MVDWLKNLGFEQDNSKNGIKEGEYALVDGKLCDLAYDMYGTNINKPRLTIGQLDAAYRNVSCVGTSIDLIAKNMQMIEPVFYDDEKQEIVLDLPNNLKNLGKVFKMPSAGINRKCFIEKIVKDYFLHGVVYFAFSFTGNKLDSIKIIDGNLVNINCDVSNSRVSSYVVNNSGYYEGEYTFKGTYYEHQTKNIILAPYIHADSEYSYLPTSPLLGAGIETLMYWYGCEHNQSLLKNGARPSLIFLIKQLLNPKHRERLREEIKIKHSGAGNAGSAIILDGSADKDVKQFSQNNKDMEFTEVLRAAEDAIYKRLGVHWVMGKNVNTKDYQEAMIILFDETICPLFQGVYNHLFDVYKYKNASANKYSIFYLEQEIPALRPRFLSMMRDMPTMGIFTIAERRKMYNYKPLGDERDDELTVQTVKVTQSGMTGTTDTGYTGQE